MQDQESQVTSPNTAIIKAKVESKSDAPKVGSTPKITDQDSSDKFDANSPRNTQRNLSVDIKKDSVDPLPLILHQNQDTSQNQRIKTKKAKRQSKKK